LAVVSVKPSAELVSVGSTPDLAKISTRTEDTSV
jgi:hypothetical protein